jgi:hypothetical protein
MNRVISRAKITIALILVLSLGTGFFCFEYFTKAGDWVMSSGSPHVYTAGHIGCGVITDRNGVLLVDMTAGRLYNESAPLRSSVIHWVGDRQGNISVPALTHYTDQILGYDLLDGVYAYGGTGGQITLTLSSLAIGAYMAYSSAEPKPSSAMDRTDSTSVYSPLIPRKASPR